MGVIGQSLPASNKFKKVIDDFAGPFQQANNYYPPQFAWDGMLAATFMIDAITRKGASSEQIKDGLDSIDLDTPQGHYTFTPQKHAGMPNSTNLMSVIKDGQFVPAPGSARTCSPKPASSARSYGLEPVLLEAQRADAALRRRGGRRPRLGAASTRASSLASSGRTAPASRRCST